MDDQRLCCLFMILKSLSVNHLAFRLHATAGDTQNCEIQDSANDVGSPTATILSGKSLTWKRAFSVSTDGKEITVQVSSVGGGKTIVFSGPLS
jgi:hypothetical protein